MAKKKMTLEEKLEDAIIKDKPYEVPEKWLWTKLQYVANWTSGGTPKSTHPEYYDGDIPWLIIADMNDGEIYSSNKTITEEGLINSSAKIIDEESVLIAMYGSIGKLGITKIKCSCNQAIAFTKEIMPITYNKFIYYYLMFYRDKIISRGKGGTQQNISLTVLKDVEIVIPPLKEQQRIVDKIESLFEKLDKAKELIEEARDDFEKRKSAILEKAFRGELSQVWREENNINREWKREKLKDITKITSGGTPSRKHPEYFEGKIPWIKTGEILWNRIYDSEEHISEEAIVNSSAKLIPEGAVLVAMYGQGLTRGRASILAKEACTNQAVCALIPSDAVLNSYLYYYFMSNYWRFRQVAKGGNQENLSGKVIGAFEIDIPSLEEQKEIVRILDKLLEEESKIEELTTLEEQIELIKKSILAKAFRGQLGTNSEDDESAIELLKEILNK